MGNGEHLKRQHIHFFKLRFLKFVQILANTHTIRSRTGNSCFFCPLSVVCDYDVVSLCPCEERSGIEPAVPHLSVKNRFDNVNTGFFPQTSP